MNAPGKRALQTTQAQEVVERVSALDWERAAKDLDTQGSTIIEGLIAPEECAQLVSLYQVEGIFRRRVVMDNHGFGRGEYKYFNYPLPDTILTLRTSIYSYLTPIANCWNTRMGINICYPPQHADFIDRCHHAGQLRPTPLLLRYREGDYNRLHQDLYGEHVFPLQVTILLSHPGLDFTGGEFVLIEERPSMQPRPEVVPLKQGDAVVFAVNHRPIEGSSGEHRVKLRHGVSRVRSGYRHTLGIIFHDAK